MKGTGDRTRIDRPRRTANDRTGFAMSAETGNFYQPHSYRLVLDRVSQFRHASHVFSNYAFNGDGFAALPKR